MRSYIPLSLVLATCPCIGGVALAAPAGGGAEASVHPVQIAEPPSTRQVGRCCYDIAPGTSECTDGITESDCDALPLPNAFFPGEACTGVPDECALGACCLPDGSCQFVSEADCLAMGGTYGGEGASCAGDGVQVFPGQGVYFYQLDLTYPGASWPDSPYGLAVVDFDEVAQATGIAVGFLNVYTCMDVACTDAAGWVVRNLPVDVFSGLPGLSVMFDLGSSGDVTSLNAFAFLSPLPNVCFWGIPDALFDVGSRENNAQSNERPGPPGQTIDLSAISFSLWELTEIVYQPGHPNIEADTNQCQSAVMANSLEWLKRKYGVNVPHPHIPGVRNDGSGSLVGALDEAMRRDAGAGTRNPVVVLDGKLDYMHENNLCDELHTKHKHREGYAVADEADGPNLLAEDRRTELSDSNATSYVNDDADVSLIDWIIGEIAAGEDVELKIGWGETPPPEDEHDGHWLCLNGGGHILGRPFLTWVHDAAQGQNGGTGLFQGGFGFSWVKDGKLKCYIGGESYEGTLDVAVSESPIYPENHARQYTATRYQGDDADDWTEDGRYEDRFDDPEWEDDDTLTIDNRRNIFLHKTVHLDLLYKTDQPEGNPNITITTSSGLAPRSTEFQWSDYRRQLLITWKLRDQPEWEKIHFPDDSYKAMTHLDRMGVATRCQLIPDCNWNFIDDRDEIDEGSSPDENGNGVPDGCDQDDCNWSEIPDVDDIASGYSLDCNENGVPDECDVEHPEMDCNLNGIPDTCDTDGGGDALDCNVNRIPDECDIAGGLSEDADGNGVPDECDREIPTVSNWGVVILALLLLAVAKTCLARRRVGSG